MRHKIATTMSLAAAATLSTVLLFPPAMTAQNVSEATSQSSASAQAGQAESMEMVSARVALTANVDAAKLKPGDQIRGRLANKVSLKDGTVLPAGSTIVGVVAADDMQMNGAAKLALNFNKAELKDGKVVPIKSTIVGVYEAESQDISGRPIAPGDEMTHTWAGRPDAVDQIGALPGVDLHSKVTSNNSGVLVATSKHDVKLKYGTEIALAVAPQSGD